MEIQETKDPPDKEGKQKHKIIKIKLKSILNDNKDLSKQFILDTINNYVSKTHKLITYGYQFFKLLMIGKYNDTMKIDRQFFYNILKCISVNNEINYDKDDKYASIYQYYNDNYKKLKFDTIENKNMSFILQYASIEMATCFENNIMMHFKDYLNKLINILFLNANKKEINEKYKNDKEIKKEKMRELITDVKNIKYDLYTNSSLVKYNGKHKKWLNNNREKLVPLFEKDNINYHLKKDSLSVLKYAIYINKEIEKLKGKPYQIFPQRNNNVYKHITLDHAGLVDILGLNLIKAMKTDKTKSYVMLHPKECQEKVFQTIFNTKHKIFKNKKFVFNYQIKTDGVSVIVDFVNHRVDKYKKKEKIDKKEDVVKKVTKKELFKKSKNEDEYLELEKLTKKQIDDINNNYVVIGLDPGIKSLMTSINEEGKVFQYNACQRRHETYHKFAHKIKEKERIKNKVDVLENELSKLNSKTMNVNDFLDFIHKKNDISNKTEIFYKQEKFRNINFRVYCREKKSEAEMLNNIEKTYKEDNKKIVIGYGNWSQTNNSNIKFFSTPCKGFRKLLASRFLLILVDEYKTSRVSSETEGEMTKQKYNVNGKMIECHKVLTTSIKDTNSKEETERCIYIDRDINGAKNILKITKSWLRDKIRPKVFCRPQQQLVKPPKKLG